MVNLEQKLISFLNDEKKLKEHLINRMKEAEEAEVKLIKVTHRKKNSKNKHK